MSWIATASDDARRISRDNRAIGNVFHCNGAGTDDREPADRHAGSDKGVRANPCTVMDCDWRLDERHVRLCVVVRSTTQMCMLRDGDLFPQDYGTQRIENRPVSYGRICADLEIPRQRYGHTGIYMYVIADIRSEQT